MADATLHHFAHPAMACSFDVWLEPTNPEDAEPIAAILFEEIDRLEDALSRYRLDSDIARLNRCEVGQWSRLGPDALAALELSQQMHAWTQGRFDIVTGALADPKRDLNSSEIDPSVMTLASLTISREYHAAVRLHPDIAVDLGGIGKGFALDQLIPILKDWQIKRAILSAGTSTALRYGHTQDQTANRKAKDTFSFRHPIDAAREIGTVVWQNGAISGSAAMLKKGHLIDPALGRSKTHHLAAWAYHDSAAVADALSTAFCLLPVEMIQACCDAHPTVGAAILRDENSDIELLGHWPGDFQPASTSAPI